ncbi:MAG: ATP-binding protein [bacterium]|nr:ATP-binding protein [bacterium]
MTVAPEPDYHRLFEAIPGHYLALSPDLVILAASDGFLRATMTRRDEITGKHLLEVFPDNPDEPLAHSGLKLQESMNRVLATHMADYMPVLQFDVRRPLSVGDGFEERYWTVSNYPVLDADGRILYLLNHAEDVTKFFLMKKDSTEKEILHEKNRLHTINIEAEVYRQAQQIEASNRKLEQTNADLETFSYSVSHDLKAPLRALDGFARLLMERAPDRLDNEDNRLLGIIRSSSNSMARLIDDLLHFSRIGRSSLRHKTINMKKMAEEVWRESSADYTGQIRIDELPDAIGDEALIRQVWINILDNAVKYSSKKEAAQITISGTINHTGSQYHIRDNGAGFDMRHIDKLFNVFQRLHKPDDFPGTGIGLAIVERIIRRHGGNVWAEGSPGKGAGFHFFLPKEEAPHD